MNIKHGIIILITAALLSVLLFSGCIAQTAAGNTKLKPQRKTDIITSNVPTVRSRRVVSSLA